jgi:hypothetical protein
MALLDGPLDLLGMVVAAIGDDQVLLPPDDVNLPVIKESEIARAEVRTLAAIGDAGLEEFLGQLGRFQ